MTTSLNTPTDRPALVVITPVRNEAWVLEAFLTCASSWADHIIIADQHSSDGSREIAARFPKVTLIDNPRDEWVEYECRTLLIEEAQKIPGDKIIFGMDADEFLSEGFQQTSEWQSLLRSKPNTVFYFDWLNLYSDFRTAIRLPVKGEWVTHFDASTDVAALYRTQEHNAVHSMRVPIYPPHTPVTYCTLRDITFVHLANLNPSRSRNKQDFYQVVNIDKNPRKANPVAMFRSYTTRPPHGTVRLAEPLRLCTADGQDCSHLVRQSDNGRHYIDEIKKILARGNNRAFAKLAIWKNPNLRPFKPHRPLPVRIIHRYLYATQRLYETRLGRTLLRPFDLVAKRILR